MLTLGGIFALATSISLIGLGSICFDYIAGIPDMKFKKKKRDKDIEEEVVS